MLTRKATLMENEVEDLVYPQTIELKPESILFCKTFDTGVFSTRPYSLITCKRPKIDPIVSVLKSTP